MKRSTLHTIVGVLVEAGRSDLAEMVVGNGVPQINKAINILKKAVNNSHSRDARAAYVYLLDSEKYNDYHIQEIMRKMGWNSQGIQNLMKQIHITKGE